MINTARLTTWDGVPRRLASISPVTLATAGLAVVAVALSASAGWDMEPAGDGALHVDLSRQIAGSLSLDTTVASHYPPLYHLVGAIGHSIAGPAGVQAISFLAFGLTSLFTFLFVRELTGSLRSALAAQSLVTFSPVLLWYSSLTLMEPLLTAAVMASLYSVLRATNDPCFRTGVFAAASLATVALIKQTGLPVVGASVLFLAVSSFGLKRTAMVALAVAIISAGPYLYVYSRTGAFTDPGQAPVAQLREQGFPGSVLTGGMADRIEPWSLDLDSEVDSPALYEQGTVLHRARHVYWRNLAGWSRFNWIHTLYPASFSGYQDAAILPVHWLLNLSLLAGYLTALYASRRSSGWRLVLLTLCASYIAMSWGTDTKRLFLYVPVIASALVVFPYVFWWPPLRSRFAARIEPYLAREHVKTVGIPVAATAAAVLVMAAVLPLTVAQFRTLDTYDLTQGGGFAAVGGVDSIEEAGAWLRTRLRDDEAFVAASVYEWEYYSERQDLWDEGLDYRAYFLPVDRLDYYLNEAGARYVVVRQNQVVEDDEWDHIERVPDSFVRRLESIYPLAYTTSYGDIKVFQVEKSEATDA